jgi:protein-S-isoprenylcysteine O-methyltransferase Ste14
MNPDLMAWLNLFVLILASLLFLCFYALSTSPAALSKRWGDRAYPICGVLRGIAMIFEFLTLVNYYLTIRFPLPTPLPGTFPWAWWVSGLIAALIGGSSLWLMIRGMIDAGEETALPKKEHTMYGGIYTKLRHPQALGEMFLWLACAFLLHSPALAVFSVIYFPIMFLTIFIEENDLLLRYGDDYAHYIKTTGLLWPKKDVTHE